MVAYTSAKRRERETYLLLLDIKKEVPSHNILKNQFKTRENSTKLVILNEKICTLNLIGARKFVFDENIISLSNYNKGKKEETCQFCFPDTVLVCFKRIMWSCDVISEKAVFL